MRYFTRGYGGISGTAVAPRMSKNCKFISASPTGSIGEHRRMAV